MPFPGSCRDSDFNGGHERKYFKKQRILSDTAGNRDAGNGGGALIVKTKDEEAMAAAMEKLVRDPVLWGKIAADAHRAGSRYAWDRMLYLNIFSLVKG